MLPSCYPAAKSTERRWGRSFSADDAARRALEAIVHPAVYDAITAWYTTLPPVPFAVADIPLLYETGRESDFDSVVVTACEPEEQVRRLCDRDALSLEEALRRIAAQLPIAEKARRADHVIRTDGSHAESDAQVDALLAALSA